MRVVGEREGGAGQQARMFGWVGVGSPCDESKLWSPQSREHRSDSGGQVGGGVKAKGELASRLGSGGSYARGPQRYTQLVALMRSSIHVAFAHVL